MNISEKIKKVRKAKKLSQQEVADRMQMNRVQYTRIETGKTEPTIPTLERIAKALEVELTDFFKNDDSFDINTKDKTLIEKIRLIENLDENQKKSIYTFIDTAIANKRFKDNLSDLLVS